MTEGSCTTMTPAPPCSAPPPCPKLAPEAPRDAKPLHCMRGVVEAMGNKGVPALGQVEKPMRRGRRRGLMTRYGK